MPTPTPIHFHSKVQKESLGEIHSFRFLVEVHIGQAAFRIRPVRRVTHFLQASIIALLLAGGSVFGKGTGFDPEKDGLSFANDTVREYLPDASGNIVSRNREKPAEFAHSCFLIARGVMQFKKFAVFAPNEPKLTTEEYRKRLLKLFKTPVWYGKNRQRIVIPGYANLWDFSADHRALLQQTLGSWRLSYVRVGNFRMGFPHPRALQALGAKRLMEALDKGELQAVYLTRFPKMNHCVVLYDYRLLKDGDIEFLAYDPNYPAKATWLRYHAKDRYFELQKRWYFNTGRVNMMRVYLSPFH